MWDCPGWHQIVYSYVPDAKSDAKTARLKRAVEAAVGVWKVVLALSGPALAALVRSDKG